MVTTKVYKVLVVLGTYLFLGSSAYTQEQGKPVKEESAELTARPKNASLVRAGYTRPGTPSDKIGKNGEILQAALEGNQGGPMIGATVYFAVYTRNSADDEFFGKDKDLGLLLDLFIPGRSFENSISPSFDRKAKY